MTYLFLTTVCVCLWNLTQIISDYCLYPSCSQAANFVAFYDSALNDEAVKNIYQKAVTKSKEKLYRYLGDVNNDKTINATDALLILKYAAKLELGNDIFFSDAADVNQDNQINASDALEILKYAAKLDSILNSSN